MPDSRKFLVYGASGYTGKLKKVGYQSATQAFGRREPLETFH